MKNFQPYAVLWRCLDTEGHESASLRRLDDGWELRGTAVFQHDTAPCRLDYTVTCDAVWKTRRAAVNGWVGGKRVQHHIRVNASGRWMYDNRELPELDDCVDVDLNFSPVTNTLPIRRLALGIGEAADVVAAWLRFPGFRLEKLNQSYRRTAEHHYYYESRGGEFTAVISVDDRGLVVEYPPGWQRVTAI